jgi:hypothetical protein
MHYKDILYDMIAFVCMHSSRYLLPCIHISIYLHISCVLYPILSYPISFHRQSRSNPRRDRRSSEPRLCAEDGPLPELRLCGHVCKELGPAQPRCKQGIRRYTYVYIYMCVWVYGCMCMCMHVYVYVYVCI